jgi:hypothetical protein
MLAGPTASEHRRSCKSASLPAVIVLTPAAKAASWFPRIGKKVKSAKACFPATLCYRLSPSNKGDLGEVPGNQPRPVGR